MTLRGALVLTGGMKLTANVDTIKYNTVLLVPTVQYVSSHTVLSVLVVSCRHDDRRGDTNMLATDNMPKYATICHNMP